MHKLNEELLDSFQKISQLAKKGTTSFCEHCNICIAINKYIRTHMVHTRVHKYLKKLYIFYSKICKFKLDMTLDWRHI